MISVVDCKAIAAVTRSRDPECVACCYFRVGIGEEDYRKLTLCSEKRLPLHSGCLMFDSCSAG